MGDGRAPKPQRRGRSLAGGRPTGIGIGREHYTVAAQAPVPPGKATIRLDFAYDGGGFGKGGTAMLTVEVK